MTLDGGRERSRTSGLYSVNLVWTSVYYCRSVATSAHLTLVFRGFVKSMGVDGRLLISAA